MRSPVLLASTVALMTLLSGVAAQADNKVGVTAAVNPQATGQPPSEPERVLLVGTENFANEKINTGPAGQVQLLFLDGTSISVGPSANLTIDQYVYDSRTKVGKLALSATEGVFRIVGGAISKSNEITLTTPIGTAGIRGGVAVIGSHPTQGMTAAFIFGTGLRVTANGVTSEATRPGFQIVVLPGQQPGAPIRITSADIRNSLAQFQGKRGSGQGGQGGPGGQQGGGQEPAIDQALDQSGVSQATGSNLSASSFTGPLFSAPFNPNTNNNIENIVAQAGTQSTAQSQGAGSTPLFGAFFSEDLYSSFNPSNGFATYNSKNQGLTRFSINLATSSYIFTSPQGFAVSLPYTAGQFRNFSSVNVGNGTASGSVMAAPDPTQFFFAAGQYTPNAGGGCNNNSGGKCAFFFFGGKPTQSTASSAFPNGGYATYSPFSVQSDPGKSQKVPFTSGLNTPTPGSSGLVVSNAYTVFGPHQNANDGQTGIGTMVQASAWIQGTGNNQSSGLVGMTAALFQENNSTVGMSGGVVGMTRDCATCVLNRYASSSSSDAIAPTPGSGLANGNAIFGPNANYIVAGPDNVTSQGSSTGNDVRTPAAAQTIPFGQQSNGPNFWATVLSQTGFSSSTFAGRTDTSLGSTLGNYKGYTGGVMDVRNSSGVITPTMFMTTAGQGPSVNVGTSPTNNTMGAVFNFTDLSSGDAYKLAFGNVNLGGGIVSSGTRDAFINDLVFGARDSRDTNGNPLSTVNGSQVSFNRLLMIPYSLAPIDFQGFAGSGVTACTCSFMRWGWWIGEVQNPSGGNFERFNLATWVAGVLPSTAEINVLSGSSNYVGHAIGNVSAGGANYIAAGNWSMNWNFSSHTGPWNVTNFDRGGAINSNGISFGGTMNPNGNNRDFTGAISGAGLNGTAVGSFYKNLANGDPAAGAAGAFNLSGGSAKIAGTFMGQR